MLPSGMPMGKIWMNTIAVVFFVGGLLQFIPALYADNGLFISIFEVNDILAFIHLLSGVLGFAFAAAGDRPAIVFSYVLLLVYGFLAAAGLIVDNSDLGFVKLNDADLYGYLVLIVVLVYTSFLYPFTGYKTARKKVRTEQR